MGKTGVLGSFEEMVLLAILHNGSDAYAVTIRRKLAQRSGSEVSMGAVYATLDRLVEKRLIDSAVEKPSKAIGRPRRFYTVLPDGIGELETTRRIRNSMWHGLSLASADRTDS
jgi:PadR family transcriptional regulator PadR